MPQRSGLSADFSKSAVTKAVLRDTLAHPLSIYPAVFAVLGGMATALFGVSPMLLAGTGGVAMLGLSSWLVNYFARRQSFAGAYLQRAHRLIEAETRARLEQLRSDLEEQGLTQGVTQLQKFQQKLDNLKQVLGRKLDPGELTYGRYLGIAEQVYLSAIDNLQQAALASRAVHTIDLGYIETRLRELENAPRMTDENSREMASLQERRTLYAQNRAQVAQLISRNESAMTEMDRTAATLASIKTKRGAAKVDLETAMSELVRLAQQAHRYAAVRD